MVSANHGLKSSVTTRGNVISAPLTTAPAAAPWRPPPRPPPKGRGAACALLIYCGSMTASGHAPRLPVPAALHQSTALCHHFRRRPRLPVPPAPCQSTARSHDFRSRLQLPAALWPRRRTLYERSARAALERRTDIERRISQWESALRARAVRPYARTAAH